MRLVRRRVFVSGALPKLAAKPGNLQTLVNDYSLPRIERPDLTNPAARSRYADTPRFYLWRRIDNRSGLLPFLDDAGCQRFQP
jgi:hypothetical protein